MTGNADGSFRPRPNVNFNFSQNDVGAVATLLGRNWVIEDCDLFGSGTIFSQDASGGGLAGAAWGRISRTAVGHGAGALFMNAWKQMDLSHLYGFPSFEGEVFTILEREYAKLNSTF